MAKPKFQTARKKAEPVAPPPSVPTKKAAAGELLPLPGSFDAEETYHVMVKEAFQIARFTVRPGEAFLLGEVATEHRLKLSGLIE